MKGLSDMLVAAANRCMRWLESRKGRRVFWTIVVCYGLMLGANSVIRAEFPKEKFVDRLHYDSPTRMGAGEDEQAKYHSSEFMGYRAIAWSAVVEGLDQYVDLGHIRAYPPFFALAFFPFAAVWRVRGLGSILFFLVCYVGGLLVARWLAWWPHREERPSFGLFAFIWLMIAPFVGAVLGRCESDMLVVIPVAAAFCLLARQEKEGLAGLLLSFAASFKVLPGLFGVYLLCQRRWRAAGGMVVGGLVFSVVLPLLVWGPTGAWRQYRSWYDHVVAPYRAEGATGVIGRPYRSTNQSLTAAVHRFLTPIQAGKGRDERKVNVAGLSSQTAGKVASVLRGLVGLGLVALWLACRRGGDTAAGRAALYATVPLGVLLLSQVSITTHHAVIFIPVGVVLVRAVSLEDPRAQRVLWCVALALFLCGIGASKTIHLLSPMLWATLLLLCASASLVIGDCTRGARPAESPSAAPAAPLPDDGGARPDGR